MRARLGTLCHDLQQSNDRRLAPVTMVRKTLTAEEANGDEELMDAYVVITGDEIGTIIRVRTGSRRYKELRDAGMDWNSQIP